MTTRSTQSERELWPIVVAVLAVVLLVTITFFAESFPKPKAPVIQDLGKLRSEAAQVCAQDPFCDPTGHTDIDQVIDTRFQGQPVGKKVRPKTVKPSSGN